MQLIVRYLPAALLLTLGPNPALGQDAPAADPVAGQEIVCHGRKSGPVVCTDHAGVHRFGENGPQDMTEPVAIDGSFGIPMPDGRRRYEVRDSQGRRHIIFR